MFRSTSLFSQVLSLIRREKFARHVRDLQGDKSVKKFYCWNQLVSMLFCQLAQAKSLREISQGLACCLGKLRHLGLGEAPARSTLSYANATRPWEIYERTFYDLVERCQEVAPREKFRFNNKLLSLDATVIDLCVSLFDWARYRQTKGAVKLHLLLDHDGYLPVFVHISEGREHEIQMAHRLKLPAGSIVAMDRGYFDFSLFGQWCERKVWFVTRMKERVQYEIVEERPVRSGGPIVSDQTIVLTSAKARRECPHRLRLVVVWDENNGRYLFLLSNHLKFAASTIAAIYKDRWQIELFFKAIKQNLRIKTFVGTTANALRIQIWTALIAMLLMKYLQFKSRLSWALSNLVALLRWNLFSYRDLWQWIDQPFDTPPLPPHYHQIEMHQLILDSRKQKCRY